MTYTGRTGGMGRLGGSMKVLLQSVNMIYPEKPRVRRRTWAGTGLTVH